MDQDIADGVIEPVPTPVFSVHEDAYLAELLKLAVNNNDVVLLADDQGF